MKNEESQSLQVAPEDASLSLLMRQAKLLSESQFLPKCYQNRPADCLVALQWAERTGRDSMELLQGTYVLHGSPGMYTKYMIALERRAKVFDKPIQWEFEGEGDSLVVTCFGYIDGERYEAEVSYEFAAAEGWTKSAKYKSRSGQKHMLKWRSASFLIRFTAPECLLGMSTVDELEDMHAAKQAPRISSAREAMQERMRGSTEIVSPPAAPTPEPKAEPEPEKVEAQPVDENCPDCGATPDQLHAENCPSLGDNPF